jgi:glycosyltransferase involved in cell wall biosynthesis
MSASRPILCFANDWATDPTSKHHLLTQFSRLSRVLWVEAAGMRRPNLTSGQDLQRIIAKVRSFTKPARQVLPSLWAYAPPAIPLPGSDIARAINGRVYRWTLARELARVGIAEPPIIWVYGPHVAPLIRGMPRSFLLYHCVDRWSAFEGYDAAFMDRCEQELCEQADLVVASAEDLAERCARWSRNVHYVPHGVDHAHFAAALEPGPLPEDLESIPRPRVGFFGLIHEWVNLDLIGRLADRLPYHFVLIGAGNQDLSAILARPNVHALGRKPFAKLPAYSRGFDAAIVPFRMTELTKSVNPIKLREYAAAGLPIVSTGLPEVRRCGDIVRIADDEAGWMSALQAAVAEGGDPAWRRSQSAKVLGEDWSAKARQIKALIARSGPHSVSVAGRPY